MKKIIILFFLISSIACQGQDICKWESRFKANRTLLHKSCSNNQAWSDLAIASQARQELILALKKGLAWAEINKNKKVKFRKIISEISTKCSSTYYTSEPSLENMFPDAKTNNYSVLQIVFVGHNDGRFSVQFFGSSKKYMHYKAVTDDNDDDVPIAPMFAPNYPSDFLAVFSSKSEIDKFLRVLTAIRPKTQDLDNAFK